MTTDGIGVYYERLGRWNRAARLLGYGGGRSTLTVHRALADPRAGGSATRTRLHDLLRQHVGPLVAPRVLDAGCGMGGTMLDLANSLDASCVGLTLSASQADTANAAARAAGLDRRVQALVHSYDDPPEGPFDLIVAIESLAHSADPGRSLSALVPVLAPGGRLAIVDDMPLPGTEGDPDLRRFKAGWQCPVLWTAAAYREALEARGLTLVRDEDLSAECRPRTLRRIALLAGLNRVARAVAPSRALRSVMDSHMGGLALERLIRCGRIQYRLLVARRPLLQVS